MTKDEEVRLKDTFMDLLDQTCATYKKDGSIGYDSLCISTYEDALDLAVEFGWIQESEVIR